MAVNLIVNANCEAVADPYIIGDGSSLSNATFARDAAEVYKGSYSFKLTKTSAAGAGTAFADQVDNDNTNDLHGLIPGKTYHYTVRVKVPSVGGPQAAEVRLNFAYYNLGAWRYADAHATGQDAWELLDCGEVTIPATATGITAYVEIHTNAEVNEFCNFDEFELIEWCSRTPCVLFL